MNVLKNVLAFKENFNNTFILVEVFLFSFLSSNCHRAFHNSEASIQEGLIAKFLSLRSSSLEERGIYISLDKLSEYYKNTPNNV